MFTSYMFPYYRSPFIGGFGFNPGFVFNPGFGFGGFNSFNGINAIGSAIANQSMNVIGTGAIGGSQIATPTVVW